MSKLFPYLFLLLRLGLGIFFLIFGLKKVADLDTFTEAVFNYQILFPPYDGYAAYFVAWLEVVAGLVILPGRWGTRGGLVAIGGMLIAFITALSIAAAKGLNINCGCFGPSDEPTNYPVHITLNCVLFAITVLLFWRQSTQRSKHLFPKEKLNLPTKS